MRSWILLKLRTFRYCYLCKISLAEAWFIDGVPLTKGSLYFDGLIQSLTAQVSAPLGACVQAWHSIHLAEPCVLMNLLLVSHAWDDDHGSTV